MKTFLISLLGLASMLSLQEMCSASSPSIKGKGLPQHGVLLRAPGDPTYENLLNRFANLQAGSLLDADGPLLIVIENATKRSVVAYSLRWEFTNAKGKLLRHIRDYGGPGHFLDGGRRKYDLRSAEEGDLIAPGSARLISPRRNVRMNVEGGATQRITGVQVSDSSLGEMKSSSELRVTLDGVFFDDGTFAGLDESGFFLRFRAHLDAKQDLMTEVLSSLKVGKPELEVVEYLESVVGQQASLRVDSTPDEFYRYYKALYASELLEVRKRSGYRSALGLAYQQEYKTKPLLQKLPR